jgi:outer membrane protein assembly factor BamB
VTERGLFATVRGEDDAGEETHALVRVDTETGAERWRRPLETGADALHVDGNGVYALLVFDDDPRTDVASDSYAELVAFDAAGEQRWRREVPLTSGPLVGDDGGLYLLATDELVALDRDGETRWRTPLGLRGRGMVARDGTVVVCGRVEDADDGSALAVDAATGEERWRRDDVYPSLRYWPTTPPVADDERVYAAGERYVVALDRESGDTAWDRFLGEEYVHALGVAGDILSVAASSENFGEEGGGRFGTIYGLGVEEGYERSEYRFETPLLDASFDGARAAALVTGGRVVVTEVGTAPVVASHEVDLDWEGDADGSVDLLGDALYVGTPERTIRKLVPPTTTETETN